MVAGIPQLADNFDFAADLPVGAARRYSALSEVVASDFAISKDHQERANQQHRAIAAANQRVNDLLRPRGLPSRVSEDDVQVQDAMRPVKAAQAELARIEDRRQEHSAVANARGNLLRRVEDYLRLNAGSVFAMVERPSPKLGKGETVGAAIDRLRRRLRELDADAARTEAAPIPSKEAKASAIQALDILAARGEIDVSDFVELGGGAIRFPMKSVQVMVPGAVPVLAHVEIVDTEALVARAMRKEMVAAIEAGVEAVADDENAMTYPARRAKLREIAQDRIKLEFDEGFFLFAEGAVLTPRADMDPAAFLGVVASERPAAPPPPRRVTLEEEFAEIERVAREQELRRAPAPSRTHTPAMTRTADGYNLPPASK